MLFPWADYSESAFVVNLELMQSALGATAGLVNLQVTIVACRRFGDFPLSELMDTLGREADDEEAVEPEKHGWFLVK